MKNVRLWLMTYKKEKQMSPLEHKVRKKIIEENKPSLENICLLAQFITLPNGSHQSKIHEEKVEQAIVDCGFIKSDIILTTEEKVNYIDYGKTIDRLKIGQYISQPRGANNNPDFIVCVEEEGKLIQYSIEAKSSKGEIPTYNGGFPKSQCVYIFSSSKETLSDQTLIYKGNDVLPSSVLIAILDYQEKIKEQTTYFNTVTLPELYEKNGLDSNRIFGVYSRVQAHEMGSDLSYYSRDLNIFKSLGTDINFIKT